MYNYVYEFLTLPSKTMPDESVTSLEVEPDPAVHISAGEYSIFRLNKFMTKLAWGLVLFGLIASVISGAIMVKGLLDTPTAILLFVTCIGFTLLSAAACGFVFMIAMLKFRLIAARVVHREHIKVISLAMQDNLSGCTKEEADNIVNMSDTLTRSNMLKYQQTVKDTLNFVYGEEII